jgi:alpha-galactosidase
MGWNSWDAYGTAVTEKDVKANADFMAERLACFGWSYVVVDIQWYQPSARGHEYEPGASLVMDEYGRLLPAPSRFPSGFVDLSDYIHGKGLRFGIHIMRGIPRQAVARNLPVKGTAYRAADIADLENGCRWNPDMWGVDTTRPGSQEYYDSLAELYASWGVDFVKADDMGSHLYQPAEIRALRRAIDGSGRPMVLSISPGPASVQEAAFFQRHAQMWRISDDFWDDWKLLRRQFDYAREWQAEIGRDGTWPDADMLPIGRLRLAAGGGEGEDSRLSRDEQRTLMNLWSIMRSPLMMGGDLPRSDSYAISLLENPEVIELNQRSRGNRHALDKDGFAIWTAEAAEGGDRYVAAFNLGDAASRVAVAWGDLGLEAREYSMRDLWEGAAAAGPAAAAEPASGASGLGLELELEAHASALYRLSPRD